MSKRNSRKCIDILKELTLGVDAETWIKGLQCGRKSMQELQANYYGTLESSQREKIARYDLKKIFYNNETTFKF